MKWNAFCAAFFGSREYVFTKSLWLANGCKCPNEREQSCNRITTTYEGMKLKSLHFVNRTIVHPNNVNTFFVYAERWWDVARTVCVVCVSVPSTDKMGEACMSGVCRYLHEGDMVFGFGCWRNKVAAAAAAEASAKKIHRSGLMRRAINAIFKIAFWIFFSVFFYTLRFDGIAHCHFSEQEMKIVWFDCAVDASGEFLCRQTNCEWWQFSN